MTGHHHALDVPPIQASIFSFLAPSPLPMGSRFNFDRNLCLVYRGWLGEATRSLYRCVVLHTNEAISAFHATILSHPDIASLVLSIELADSQSSSRKLGKGCPVRNQRTDIYGEASIRKVRHICATCCHLRELVFQSPQVQRILHSHRFQEAAPLLKTLTLYPDPKVWTTATFATTLAQVRVAHPHLKSLALVSDKSLDTKTTFTPPQGLETLHTLALSIVMDAPQMQCLSAFAPNLRALYLEPISQPWTSAWAALQVASSIQRSVPRLRQLETLGLFGHLCHLFPLLVHLGVTFPTLKRLLLHGGPIMRSIPTQSHVWEGEGLPVSSLVTSLKQATMPVLEKIYLSDALQDDTGEMMEGLENWAASKGLQLAKVSQLGIPTPSWRLVGIDYSLVRCKQIFPKTSQVARRGLMQSYAGPMTG